MTNGTAEWTRRRPSGSWPSGPATLAVSQHDAVAQRVTTQDITFDAAGMHLRPVAIRYAWPSELNLMASQAGLTLAERYSGWDGQPFLPSSGQHVSVYQRA
jgi:hypothetical protein